MTSPITVLLVDDSPLALAVLRNIIDSVPGMKVVGTARDGEEALAAVERLNPGVVCTDLHMPRMDGLTLVREIMATSPRPILVVSVSVQVEDRDNAFALLEAGALDLCPKPRGDGTIDELKFRDELVRKIRVIAGVQVFTRWKRSAAEPAKPPAVASPGPLRGLGRVRLVAIGASTGGPVALRDILCELPATLPVPVLCVQHINEEFLGSFVAWLQTHTRLRLKLAGDGEACSAGKIYFPPGDCHLEVDGEHRLRLSAAPPVDGHRPSVTATFRSVARHYRDAALGVLLTGMGVDGAEGLADIARAGGVTIAQDEATSVVFGMPGHAVALGAAQHVLALREIAQVLGRQLQPGAS